MKPFHVLHLLFTFLILVALQTVAQKDPKIKMYFDDQRLDTGEVYLSNLTTKEFQYTVEDEEDITATVSMVIVRNGLGIANYEKNNLAAGQVWDIDDLKANLKPGDSLVITISIGEKPTIKVLQVKA
ncbi:hypothetical protein [Marinoscillum sp.]|uniref:hypothetical protein n=1 Tax=Marinoscillum sp. TaxID=2024838 RepID=UPI003BA9BC37